MQKCVCVKRYTRIDLTVTYTAQEWWEPSIRNHLIILVCRSTTSITMATTGVTLE